MSADLSHPKAPFSAKAAVFPCLILTTLVSCLLLGLTWSNWYNDGFLYNVQNIRRATIQIIVQVLSTVLAGLQSLSLSTLIIHDTKLRIGRKPMTLDTLMFRMLYNLRALTSTYHSDILCLFWSCSLPFNFPPLCGPVLLRPSQPM